MSAPAPPEAQAGIRRSAPVIAGGVAGASIIALLAVSSVVAPALAGGVSLATFLTWLGSVGGNALAGWLTAWASDNLARFEGDDLDRERRLLEQLARDLTVQLERSGEIAADTELLIARSDAVAVALDALSGQTDKQARLLQMLLEDLQRATVRNERLHEATLRAVEAGTRQILAAQVQGGSAIQAQLQALLATVERLEAIVRQAHSGDGKVVPPTTVQRNAHAQQNTARESAPPPVTQGSVSREPPSKASPTITGERAEAVRRQRRRLEQHRETLAHYLEQLAITGLAHARPEVTAGLREARAGIARAKQALAALGASAEDMPDDTP